MTTKNRLLGQLSIPSPCSADWSDLVGDDRRRYCEHCDKNVYDFSKMTATEAVALLATLRGRVCARITWRPDGTVLTEEPPPVLPVVRRRASPFASVAVTTLITITGSPAGRPPAQAASIVQTNLDVGTPVLDQSPQPADVAGSIAGTVFDQKAVIAGARVLLINQASGETRVVTSSDIGEFHFSGLGEGAFSVRVESPGFATSQTQDVKLAARQEQRVDVTMQVVEVVRAGGVVGILPRPLRVLYNESDLIVVARIGESKPVEREGEARRFKTTLHVSSFLKGTSNGSTVDLYHWSYGDLKGPFDVGEEMLLFLKASRPEPGRKSRGGYEIDDTQYGIKKVAGSALRAYLDRIEELSQVNHENGPVDAAILEWLVRCAEDPATRWEGAYELVMSIDRHSDRKVDEDTPAEPTASTSAESADAEEEPDPKDVDEEPDFSALITVEQKARLMTALFQTKEVQDRDLQLMELAQRWKEPRLVPFLIEQLHRLEAEPPRIAERLMDIVTAALNDEAIAQLAEDYESNVSYPDEDGDQEPGEARAQTADAARDEKAAAAIQNRSEMLREFLRVVEVALAEKQLK